jgi:hypothetical protein
LNISKFGKLIMRHNFLGLLAFSLVLSGFVISHSASAQFNELSARAVINAPIQLNPQPEPPGYKGGVSLM